MLLSQLNFSLSQNYTFVVMYIDSYSLEVSIFGRILKIISYQYIPKKDKNISILFIV